MNVENIMKVREAIRLENLAHFDMKSWLEEYPENITEFNVCGTTACIGGHCDIIMRKAGLTETSYGSFSTTSIAEWLGISRDTATELFYGLGFIKTITKDEAITVLDKLMATGGIVYPIRIEDRLAGPNVSFE